MQFFGAMYLHFFSSFIFIFIHIFIMHSSSWSLTSQLVMFFLVLLDSSSLCVYYYHSQSKSTLSVLSCFYVQLILKILVKLTWKCVFCDSNLFVFKWFKLLHLLSRDSPVSSVIVSRTLTEVKRSLFTHFNGCKIRPNNFI